MKGVLSMKKVLKVRVSFLLFSFILLLIVTYFVPFKDNYREDVSQNIEYIELERFFINEDLAVSVTNPDMFINPESMDNIFIDNNDCYFDENSLFFRYENTVYELVRFSGNQIMVNEPLFKNIDSEILEKPMGYFIIALQETCSSLYRVDDIMISLVAHSADISRVIYNMNM